MMTVRTGLLALLFSISSYAQDVRTYVPTPALALLPELVREQQIYWPDHPKPHILPALIEHESCIGLKHSKCWNSMSRLKTAREEGAGLGQITRAYRLDGSIRFDALAEIRAKHPQLKDLNWGNVYSRPDLQMRAVIFKMRDNYTYYKPYAYSYWDTLAFADAAYNGGIGGLDSERRACKISSNCDPTKWFGHVENFCLKSKAALYGNRSACTINRHHVDDVLNVRSPKYTKYFSN